MSNRISTDQTKEELIEEAKSLICPVCGYYCNSKGGVGCIRKNEYLNNLIKLYEI